MGLILPLSVITPGGPKSIDQLVGSDTIQGYSGGAPYFAKILALTKNKVTEILEYTLSSGDIIYLDNQQMIYSFDATYGTFNHLAPPAYNLFILPPAPPLPRLVYITGRRLICRESTSYHLVTGQFNNYFVVNDITKPPILLGGDSLRPVTPPISMA